MSSELMSHEETLLREVWMRTRGVVTTPLKDQAIVNDEHRHARLIAGVANRDLMRWAETPTGKSKGAVVLAAYADALHRLLGGRGYLEHVPDSATDEERLQVSSKGAKLCMQLFGRPWDAKSVVPPRVETVVTPTATPNHDALSANRMSRKAAAAQRAPRVGGKFASRSARPGVQEAAPEPLPVEQEDETDKPSLPRSYNPAS